MQKYGFKEGQGLGKHEQGLSTALSVEKTSKRGGKIIIGDSAEKGSTQLLVPAPGVGPGDTCTELVPLEADPLHMYMKHVQSVDHRLSHRLSHTVPCLFWSNQ